MVERSYDQFCGLATTLDLVGERWTLLVVRELMTGPKRYTDLLAALGGIGTSLLAQRLKRLESHRILERQRLGPPAASTVYRLTASGEELAESLVPLIRWGVRHALPAAPTAEMTVEPHWTLIAFTHPAHPEALRDLDATFEFEIDGRTVLLAVRDGRARLAPSGSVDKPDATIRLGATTIAALGAGRTTVEEEARAGRLQFDGDLDALAALTRAFAGESDGSRHPVGRLDHV
jgi:DNA-binding HxlR family transcriptional regulator